MLDVRKSKLIEQNRLELGVAYNSLRWISEKQSLISTQERDNLLKSLRHSVTFSCKNTKVAYRNLSPGCELCVQGDWSCLFINGRCNCRCFYCPSRQDEDSLPTTNTIQFSNPRDYVDYIRRMGFRGVSFSGGEPLLKLDETLRYIRSIKQVFGDTAHTWLYTNGTLANVSTLRKLREAGLDEIRFDIGATELNLDAAKRAVDMIDTVTVEIPSLPEQVEIMKEKILEMRAAGIKYLNLHQLRLTLHNLPELIKRNYTFLHGERVTVFESELTALQLMYWTYTEGIPLPVNYCSFVYKNRFQRAAARKKNALFIRKPYEDITENGYIRMIEIKGEPDQLARLIDTFRQNRFDETLWIIDTRSHCLRLSALLWITIDCSLFRTSVFYAEAKILSSITYRNFFIKVTLNTQRDLFVEKIPCNDVIHLTNEFAIQWQSWLAGNCSDLYSVCANTVWEQLYRYECIEEDLAEYF